MKRIITVFVTIIFIISLSIVAFAEPDTSVKEAPDSIIYDCPTTPDDRGTSMPTVAVPLYPGVTYSGSGTYYSGVYTNYLFTQHNGSIQIYVSNSNDILNDIGVFMQVNLCHKNSIGIKVVDQTRSVWVNGFDTFTFYGLNTNQSYFFQFTQNFSSDPTTTVFQIQRGS